MNNTIVSDKDKTAYIHNPNYVDGVLALKDVDWQLASRNLNGVALKLYLYLAAGADEATIILNAFVVTMILGFTHISYHNGLRELTEYGYLVPRTEKEYDFYTSPYEAPTAL